MFQPQPTPFASASASACFSSNAYLFAPPPPPPAPPPSTSTQPPDASTPYGIINPTIDFAYQLPPTGGAGAGSVGGNIRTARNIYDPSSALPLFSSSHHQLLPQLRQQLPMRQQRQRQQIRRSPLPKMEDQGGRHSITAQQAAAKDYQPSYEGRPRVGDVIPSDAITEEYAKADPIYVEKTINFPHKFSHYRPIRGDGNCGWRAIGFSYFEKLIEVGNRPAIESEIARLASFNQMLPTAGGYEYWEDFADDFIRLLREIADHMANPGLAHQLLVQRWNDQDASNSCLYYLRMISATYLKLNAATYDPFLADDRGIADYCSTNIELPDTEIENMGLIALVNILLKPVNFVLEVAYLDRSPGSQPNIYRFPEEANGQEESALGTVIYLLFRPTHYDILYRSSPNLPVIPAPSAPVSIQVHRVGYADNTGIASTQTDLGMYSTVDFTTLAMLPGFSAPAPMSSVPPVTEAFPPTPQPQNPWAQQFCDGMTASSSPPQPPVVVPQAVSQPPMSPLGARPGMMPDAASAAVAAAGGSECTIRFSPMQLEYNGSKSSYPEPTFQVTTNTFKNSVWNRAHFGNPDFHPEEWVPDDDGIDARVGVRKKWTKY